MFDLNNEIEQLNSLLEQHYKKEPKDNEFTRAMIVITKLRRKLERIQDAVGEFASDDVCSMIEQIVYETPEPTEY